MTGLGKMKNKTSKMKTLKKLLIYFVAYALYFIASVIFWSVYLVGLATVKASEIKLPKIAIFAALIVLASYEKEPAPVSNCWDCLIKQNNGIEYPAIYCCTENEIALIANERAGEVVIVTCNKR